MDNELCQKLVALADKYEMASFCDDDPSQYLRWYSDGRVADVECASFVAAMLAFGSRSQFIPKIALILKTADNYGGISHWINLGSPSFPHGTKKFYRFYSYDDMHVLFLELSKIIKDSGTLGNYFKKQYIDNPQIPLSQLISQAFPTSALVPKGKTSACKRLHMFLRWMVRQNSPVDLGLWNWYSPSNLLLPLDTHVMQQSIKMGLLPPKTAPSFKTAVLLTQKMSQIFPGDPTRADFALFGLGVDFGV